MSQQPSSEISAASRSIAAPTAAELATRLFERHHHVEIFAYLKLYGDSG